jgi:hypothetical protein
MYMLLPILQSGFTTVGRVVGSHRGSVVISLKMAGDEMLPPYVL